jgi:hyperosmotically inducible periplasmic protein
VHAGYGLFAPIFRRVVQHRAIQSNGRPGMNNLIRVAAGFAAGALLMYYLDPAGGRRRRALVRDKAIATGHDVERLAQGRSRQVADRVRGVVARTRNRFSREAIDDDRLHERIQARLGRMIDRPGAVEVEVRDGCVVLRGSAAGDEIDELVEAIASMRGVEEVDCRLVPASAQADAEGGGADARH